jgi:hypothetical protein
VGERHIGHAALCELADGGVNGGRRRPQVKAPLDTVDDRQPRAVDGLVELRGRAHEDRTGVGLLGDVGLDGINLGLEGR